MLSRSFLTEGCNMTADFDADHFLKWLEGQTTGTGWQFSFGLVAFS